MEELLMGCDCHDTFDGEDTTQDQAMLEEFSFLQAIQKMVTVDDGVALWIGDVLPWLRANGTVAGLHRSGARVVEFDYLALCAEVRSIAGAGASIECTDTMSDTTVGLLRRRDDTWVYFGAWRE